MTAGFVRLGSHIEHPVIAASCAVLSVAVLAEYVFSMAARVPGTATVRDIVLALAVLAGLVGGRSAESDVLLCPVPGRPAAACDAPARP